MRLKLLAPTLAILSAFAVLGCHRRGGGGMYPTTGPGGGVAQDCLQDADPGNLCKWTGAPGSSNRQCNLDVETLPREMCDYVNPPRHPFSHKPLCVSPDRQEHIVFTSSLNRSFRIRRFISLNSTAASGHVCPAQPFVQQFDLANVHFNDTAVDTGPVDPVNGSIKGCFYKFEVQFQTVDPSAPSEPNDPGHGHYECRDPHFKVGNK